MADIVFLYTTAPDAQTAQAIAQVVVEARLAACANIIPGMRSVYRWRMRSKPRTKSWRSSRQHPRWRKRPAP